MAAGEPRQDQAGPDRSAAGAGRGAGLVGCASSCRDSWWWAAGCLARQGGGWAAAVLRLADAGRHCAGGAGGQSAPGPAGHGTTNWAVWVVGSLPAANDTV